MSEGLRTVIAVSTNLSYVSLFSSAGLGCFGFLEEGFECIATAELLPRRLEVQKANAIVDDPAGYVLGDLTDPAVRSRVVNRVSSWIEAASHRELTVVIATPPCQGMSVANHKKRSNEIPRNSLVVESLRIIAELRPRFFVIENVRSFLKANCLDTDGTHRTVGAAIDQNLAASYNITSAVINLKDYGSPSSRTRTLVVGVRRDIRDVRPSEFLPEEIEAPTLRALIGHLPTLTSMGELDPNDIYHGFRGYDARMRPWISAAAEGQSAFANNDPQNRPHRIIGGIRVENKASNGDKYRRNYWDKAAPCVHTRNDILASQSTVHPRDDRVFSIRELMRMMGVPDQFRWAPFGQAELDALPDNERREFLAEHEINIRQCLGEGVPTPVFRSIAKKIRSLPSKVRRKREPATSQSIKVGSLGEMVTTFEESNPRRRELAAFYTRQDIAYQLVSQLPEIKTRGPIRILEPSVGSGAFIPSLVERYSDREVYLDLLELDPIALQNARKLVDNLSVPSNIHFRFIEANFLTHKFEDKYDLVVGNPPFGRTIVAAGDSWSPLVASRELFSMFLQRSIQLGRYIAFVVPKLLIGAPEHSGLRELLNQYAILGISDYGEAAFHDIKIETIGIVVGPAQDRGATRVNSLMLKELRALPQDYITDSRFAAWLPYRDEFFDIVASHMRFNAFRVVRDRELSSKDYGDSGDVAVCRGRDIPRNLSQRSLEASTFISSDKLPRSARGYFGNAGALVAPNLSYFPRARYLPPNTIADGSAAVLLPLEEDPTVDQVEFFSSEEFFWFYRIARSYATRTLNIDSVSIGFWGLADEYLTSRMNREFTPNSHMLFERPDVLEEKKHAA